MAGNRKSQSAAIRFGPALKAVFLCLLIAGSAIGYVWQKNEIYRLSQQIRQGELRLKQMTDDNEKLRVKLADLRFAADAGPAGARVESGPGSGATDAGLAAAGAFRRAAGEQCFGTPVGRAAGWRAADAIKNRFGRRS